MTFSFNRVYAIFEKDLKDLSKNMYVLTTLLMPLLVAVMLSRGENLPIGTHFLAINLVFTAVTCFVQCAIIAEEKEKHTLRGLMLSPATTFEIIGGKSLLSFLLTIVAVVICAFITGYEPASLLPVSLAIAVSTFFYLALGTLLGLMAKSVMQASVIVLPIIFVFGFGASFQVVAEKYPLLSFLNYLPNIQLERLAEQVQTGAILTDVWTQVTAIAGWVAGTCVLVAIVYKKTATDD